VRVKYLDRDGKLQETQAEGLLATCLQHEIDHLNGVLFIDYISKLKRDMVVKKFKKLAKDKPPAKLAGYPGPTNPLWKRVLAGPPGRGKRRMTSNMSLRVIFMGTPEFSVPTCGRSRRPGHEVVAVYTQPPRAAGRRGLELTPSPVQREAERLGIEVRTPASLKR
jgi:hypothetical protein